jgi:hypothetical protein
MIDLTHIIVEAISIAAATATPLILYMRKNRDKAKEENEARHVERMKALGNLVEVEKYYPHHAHRETGEEVLRADGIGYPPK